MYSFSKKEMSSKEIIYLFMILTISICIQVMLIKLSPKYALLGIIFFNLVLITLLFYEKYFNDFSVYLLIINFLPLLILNNYIHYEFKFELLSLIPIYVLIFLSIFKFVFSEEHFSYKVGYLEFPIILIVIYFGINALVAISGGKSTTFVVNEFFHFLLYLTIIPVLYLINKRDKYLIILKYLLVVSILVSIEYVIYNYFIIGKRFATFQSGFLPLALSVIGAYFLYKKGFVKKTLIFIILTILIAGTFVTLTRTLWATSLFSLLLVIIIYLKIQNKLTFSKSIFIALMLIIPVILIKDSIQQTQVKPMKTESTEYRTQSISKPLEDSSFLMRVELGYYAIERFISSPIIGKGLGDFVRYKIFVDTKMPINYLDSTWLYLLWKGGIIGFLLFGWLYFRFLKSAFFVLRNSQNIHAKAISLGLIAGFIGLIFLGILSPLLIKYKSNVLIAFLFAYIEFERLEIISEH